MNDRGSLLLTLVDDEGNRIQGEAEIELRHERISSERKVVKSVTTSKTIEVPDLRPIPDGLYQLFVQVAGFEARRQIVNIRASSPTEVRISLPRLPSVPELEETLRVANESVKAMQRIRDLLQEHLLSSPRPTDVDVYRIVIAPWLSQSIDITQSSLDHLVKEARAGNEVSLAKMRVNFERQAEGLARLELSLSNKVPGTAADECTYETGWAVAGTVFAVGACAVSLGVSCFASAVFAVKAIDDATEACQ